MDSTFLIALFFGLSLGCGIGISIGAWIQEAQIERKLRDRGIDYLDIAMGGSGRGHRDLDLETWEALNQRSEQR